LILENHSPIGDDYRLTRGKDQTLGQTIHAFSLSGRFFIAYFLTTDI
jgi:hypothetical protein